MITAFILYCTLKRQQYQTEPLGKNYITENMYE